MRAGELLLGVLGSRGRFIGCGDEPGALGNRCLGAGEVLDGALKRGFVGIQRGLRGCGFLRLGLLFAEIGPGSGKLGFGGGLLALELLVALDHGVQLPQNAGGLGVFFFGVCEGCGGLLIFTGWVALRGGEVALVFLVHAGQERGIVAGDLFLGQAGFAL